TLLISLISGGACERCMCVSETPRVHRMRGTEEVTNGRQEQEAVRGAEGQGDVQGAGSKDRKLPRRLIARRKAVRFGRERPSGRHDRTEEGSGPQGRQGRRQETLNR